MKEDPGSDDMSEVQRLRMEVETLTELCSETRQELLTHRQVLEQCLELREGVQDLLEDRETLKQCVAMEDSIQAVAQGAKIINEIGDRQLEMDLSLAGVSDNTARHGKAISTLAEQQKRTASTMEAVVRAVKRLARSRSRSGGPTSGARLGSGSGAGDFGDDQWGSARGAAVPQEGYLPPVLQELMPRLGGRDRLEESEPRLLDTPLEDWGNLVDEIAGRFPRGGDDRDWIGAPGWPPLGTTGLEADVLGNLNAMTEGPMGGYGGACGTSEEELRYWSGSSSCGSENRALRNGSQRTARPGSKGASRRYRGGAGGHGSIPDICLRGPGDLGRNEPLKARRSDGINTNAPIASPEMASCVQGVLARIEEALTKLDSGGPQEANLGTGEGSRPSPGGQGQRPSNGDTGRESRREPNSRPHSARGTATARGAGTPRATTPRARAGRTLP